MPPWVVVTLSPRAGAEEDNGFGTPAFVGAAPLHVDGFVYRLVPCNQDGSDRLCDDVPGHLGRHVVPCRRALAGVFFKEDCDED